MNNKQSEAARARMRSGLRCTLAAMAVGLCVAPGSGQCLEEQALTASDAASGDGFGGSVSMSADTALVGARGDHCAAGPACGSAYVYRFNGTGWIEEQKLTASDAAPYAIFGNHVSVSGNVAVVGSAGFEAVYVFRFNGTSWIEEQKLTPSDGRPNDFFGFSVSVSENTIWVGSPREFFNFCGAAYVFRYDGNSWEEEQIFALSGLENSCGFGFSVSLSRNTAVVGAFGDACTKNVNEYCGSAYVYHFDGISWVEQQQLVASDANTGDDFGHSVSVSGDTVVVGAQRADCSAGVDCGAAYVFRFNGTSWIQEQRLVASDASAGDRFGRPVSISGQKVAIGASYDDCATGADCGSAYMFRYDGTSWIQEQKVTAPDPEASHRYGFSVSQSDDKFVVGNSGADCLAGESCGSAYVFSCAASGTIVNFDIKPDSCPNMVNPRSRGVVRAAIVGSLDFDAVTIDPDSLTLARADGVGGSVSPLSERGGRGIVLKDLSTPFDGEPCECHDANRDRIDDLALKFSTTEMNRAFQLNGLRRGTTIELVLQGTLQDGTPFEGADCIVIPGSERTSNRRHLSRRPK
ncbi:MAG: FG-GAP repeat protein [Planctomycetes bacterium]|nr:FG-GAP repeat protein [Planctomycetota bacterium]